MKTVTRFPLGTRCTVGRMAGWSADRSRCWHFALNDERQRGERRTDDRRQRTEDGGCMSLCMPQPSSFVLCPLSFVLETSELMIGCATAKARTSDFRRRTSVESGGRYMRWPRGGRVVGSRMSDVPNRGSGTLAASALARHCEATGVSLPRGGRAAADGTNGTTGTSGTLNQPPGICPALRPSHRGGPTSEAPTMARHCNALL